MWLIAIYSHSTITITKCKRLGAKFYNRLKRTETLEGELEIVFIYFHTLYFNLRRILKNRKPRPPVETNTSDGFENKVLKIIDPIKREGPVLNFKNNGLELKVIGQLSVDQIV